MKVDVHALGTFNRLAHEGAEHAAASLSQLTAVSPSVEATKINLVSRETVGETFDAEFVGVEIGFEGGLAGRTVLAFDPGSARRLLETLPGESVDAPLSEQSGRVEEIGNILIGGFMDGWADYLGAAIDITPPTYVSGTGVDLLPEDAPVWDDFQQVFAFTSQLEADAGAVNARIYMFPERASFERVVTAQSIVDDTPIPMDKLAVFNRMTREGARNASDNITTMTGMETTVDVSQLSFVPIETAPAQLRGREYVGVVFELDGLPSGYLLVLFDEPSAAAIADHMLPTDTGEGFGDMEKSAIEEIGNIMASGFIDGWANVLGTTIDHSPPQFVHDMGQAIMDPVAVELGRTQEYAFMIDSTIRTADREIGCEIYALPNEAELKRALNALSVDPDEPLPEMDASYEDL